ncbi:ER membrane complex subunit 4-like [Micractinium conductrix]|uniref:ER membrane protein complex subunit 4 n=1 Tax=Micractinium conductrix TaxID=554055 RepID=A0A2P6V3A6_9CHLO|nr:ER membrane complex subunit 4-like [Micractinium conductrix]|eukprot:PSC68571.1 ER membrane complex subunit 4-like [Micractinium conductrix]
MAPAKQVAMLCFMMWMSGSTLHLFSIMTTLSGIYQPLSAILKNRAVFPDDPEKQLDTWTPRLTYCLIHGLGIAFAVWKINGMGLLPTHLSDWVSSMRPPAAAEHAAASLL